MIALNPTQTAGVVAFACAALANITRMSGRRRQPQWFAAFAVVYGLASADIVAMTRYRLGEVFRDLLKDVGEYDGRRQIQTVFLATSVLAIGLTVVGGGRFVPADLRPAASVAAATMWLFLLETVSLHQVDHYLYLGAGPLLLIGWAWSLLGMLAVVCAVRNQG